MYLLAINPEIQVKGWIVTIAGFIIVILTLIILYFIFSGFSKLVNYDWSKAGKNKKKEVVTEKVMKGDACDVSDDVAVAIALALSLSAEVHDSEPDEITIERVQRRYSPWSSKLYGMYNNLK